MARLKAYYTLCPLIDEQSVGVEKDKEPDCAIVTLGNIVIRYKLQDLKQISSWSSKEKLTTQVIYDRSKQRYAAVFNQRRIRVWLKEETDLNSVKGYKFQSPLYAILPRDDAPPVVIQLNGATASLEWAIKNRNTWTSKGVIRTNEKLLDCQLIQLNGKTSLFCLTKVEDVHNCVVFRLEDETCLERADTVKRIELKRGSEDLVGHTVVHCKNNAHLLALWSDGSLYSYFLTGTSTDPSTKLISMITNINTRYPTVIAHLNESIIAVYGADVTDEGAVLMLYNVQLKLVQATQKLKLYTNDAKLWKVEDKLLLAANRHLAIAPYHLAPHRISTMHGPSLRFKNESNEKNSDDIIVIHDAMGDKSQARRSRSLSPTSSSIPKPTHVNSNEGSSDRAPQETLILNLMESNDVASICRCLDKSNLPGKLLVDLLAFALKSPEKVPVQNGTTDGVSRASGSYSRNAFLAKVLSNGCPDVISLLPHLKTGLTFDEVLKLMEYLIDKMSEETDSLDDNPQPSDHQLYEWFRVLLDSHYQNYLLSQDAHVVELFNQLNMILEQHFQILRDLENLRPILDRTNQRKPLRSSSIKHNKFYSIEEIKLY